MLQKKYIYIFLFILTFFLDLLQFSLDKINKIYIFFVMDFLDWKICYIEIDSPEKHYTLLNEEVIRYKDIKLVDF